MPVRFSTRRLCASILFLAGMMAGCVNDDEPVLESLVKVGDRLPQFEVTMDDGHKMSTGDLAGRRSVVVLFTTSCADCRRYLPVVEDFHLTKPEVPIVCIARSEDAATLRSYWTANGLTLPYSPQPDDKIYSLFATGGVPRTYVSDASFTVIAEWDDSPVPTLEQFLAAVTE